MHKDKVSFIEPLHFHHNRHSMLPLKLVISTQIYWFYVSVQVFSIVLVFSMFAILPFAILPFVSLPNFSRSKTNQSCLR